MVIFEKFNTDTGDMCPICGTNKEVETVLVPIPGTEKDGLFNARQVHKKCYDVVMEMNDKGQTAINETKIEDK